MCKYISLFVALFWSTNIKSQSIHLAFGPVFTKTDAVVAIVNGKEDFENTDYMVEFRYSQYLNNKYSINATYSKFKGCTFIFFEEGGYINCGGEILAKGFCDGVKIHRLGFDVSRQLSKHGKKYYFSPYGGLNIQISRKTGVEYWRYDGCPINGPNYFEEEPPIAEPLNTTQIVPSLGFRTGFLFWKRIDLGLGVQGVYAFKPYQKMYLKYQYKGTPQPEAEYESTGTGVFVTIGVGYRFAKLIK
jgi:hypothetical protein